MKDIKILVQSLLLQGYGRRKIAKELNITQWEARKLIEQVKVSSRPVSNAVKPLVKVENTNKAPEQKATRTGKPTIKVTSLPSANDHFNGVSKHDIGLKVAVLSDIHVPYEDTKAVAITKEFLKDWKPDLIILNGDICDFYQVSSYDKERGRPSFEQEVEYAKKWLADFAREFPDADIKMTEGNHCNRLERYLAKNAAALSTLPALSVEGLLDLKANGIHWIPDDQDIQVGDLTIMHGTSSRKDAGSTAKAHYGTYGSSILVGHIHRGSVAYKRTKAGISTLIENPCLCDISVDYCRFPDWAHGFTTLVFSGNMFSAQTRLIQNYTLITDNKVYIA